MVCNWAEVCELEETFSVRSLEQTPKTTKFINKMLPHKHCKNKFKGCLDDKLIWLEALPPEEAFFRKQWLFVDFYGMDNEEQSVVRHLRDGSNSM